MRDLEQAKHEFVGPPTSNGKLHMHVALLMTKEETVSVHSAGRCN